MLLAVVSMHISQELIMRSLSRRKFITETLVSTVAVGGALATVAGLASPVQAIEPITRPGPAKFKFSLAAYSYRDLFKPKDASQKLLTLDDFVRDCAKMQLDGTELTSYYFPTPLTDEYLRNLASLCFKLGLDVSGTAIGNDFCFPAGAEREKQIATTKQWIDRAAVLGAPVIRIFSGKPQPGQNAAEAHKLAVAGIEECCDYSGKRGVHLALENHGGLTATPDGMLKIVEDVKSPWFGANLDSGNFHGEDVYADLARIAPYALNVQIKVVVTSAGKKKEASDFKRLAKLLRDTGYRGYIVLEYEEPEEDPRTACPRYIEQLRETFA